ncbi:MAG: hypothetical protein ACOY4T_01510 [Pseudomonadota bacterium]
MFLASVVIGNVVGFVFAVIVWWAMDFSALATIAVLSATGTVTLFGSAAAGIALSALSERRAQIRRHWRAARRPAKSAGT